MHTITQIEVQKKNEKRLNIYLDGAFAFGLDEEVVIRHHLHEGDQLEESVINKILLLEERTKTKGKALSLLSYRMHSVEELKKKLKEKGFAERTISDVIQDLIRVGLLDDKQFALAYVQTRMIQKPMSKRFLRQELISKGIEDVLIEHAVEKEYGTRSETEVALDLIRKKILRHQSNEADPKKIRKTISDFLMRRGFDWDVIGEVVRGIDIEQF